MAGRRLEVRQSRFVKCVDATPDIFLALKTDWTLTDGNDAEAFKARTVVSFQTDEIFPNTEDEAFKDIMLEFAKASTDDFLLLLQGKEPLNGNESVFRY